MLRHVSYSDKAFNNVEGMIKEAKKALKDVDFDTMIGTGLSGSVAIPVLARELGKKFAIIRKEGDNAHSNAIYEGSIGDKWIFVDDFISAGNTFRRVYERVGYASHDLSQFVGAYTYESGTFHTPQDLSHLILPY